MNFPINDLRVSDLRLQTVYNHRATGMHRQLLELVGSDRISNFRPMDSMRHQEGVVSYHHEALVE